MSATWDGGPTYLGRPIVFPREYRVTDDGLTHRYEDGQRVTTPWPDVRLAERRTLHAIISVPEGPLWLGPDHGNWMRIAEQVRQRSEIYAQVGGAKVLAPERIAELLGVPLDGHLSMARPLSRIWALVALVAVVGAMIGIQFVFASSPAGVLASCLFGTLWTVGAMLRSVDRVRADAHGLTVRTRGRSRSCAWSQVESVQASVESCVVRTSRGSFRFYIEGRQGQKLVQVLQLVTKARSVGIAVPDDAPVSEAAISRMTGEADASADRGISLTDGPPP